MNYKIEAIKILLDKNCILERYYPLILFKDELIKRFKYNNIFSKEDALTSDNILIGIFKDDYLVNLFKKFLNMYEINKSKLKEIDKLILSKDEKESFMELYLLPGVKETRARLYYLSSLKTLKDISLKTPEEIINLTKKTINDHNLNCKEPLYKEASTHIAVAKLLTEYIIK